MTVNARILFVLGLRDKSFTSIVWRTIRTEVYDPDGN